jgi:glutaredoxin 3
LNDKIVVYSKFDCSWCTKTKALLEKYNLEYEEFKIGKDLSREDFFNIVGPNVKTVPQIYINGIRIGGYESLVDYLQKPVQTVCS